MNEIPISRKGFHFITITDEGLEILGEPSGEKTVITNLVTLNTLGHEALRWVERNRCAMQYLPGHGNVLRCELHTGHPGAHQTREYDSNYTTILYYHEWSTRTPDSLCGKLLYRTGTGEEKYCALRYDHSSPHAAHDTPDVSGD